MNLTGGQLIVHALLGEGVDTIFGISGSHVLAIYDALRDTPEIRNITMRHEHAAALAAEAYGRLTGKPGVVIVTAGPGATNALSGIAQAYTTAAPVVIITGSVPPNARPEVFHGVDDPTFLHQIFTPVTKRTTRVLRAADIPNVLAEAFSLAVSGRPGPVHIELDESVLKATVENVSAYVPSPREKHAVDSTVLERFAESLRGAQRPVILAGRGVLASFAQSELARLAEALAAPVIFTGDALGVMSYRDKWCAGLTGTMMGPNPLCARLLKEADVLLGIGLRPNAANLEPVLQGLPGHVVILGFDDRQVDHVGAAQTYVTDIKPATQALANLIEPNRRAADEEILTAIEVNKRAMLDILRKAVEPYRDKSPLHFGLVVEELARHMTPDTIVMGDVGNHNAWSAAFLSRLGADRFYVVGPWAAMGYALPGAIGAKVGCPNAPVVGITGDGAFLMSSHDFATAVQNRLPIVYVILNDGRFGMVEMLQRRGYGRTYATEIEPSNFAKYAESFGARGITVSRASELRPAFEEAFKAQGPVIVEAICDPNIPYASMSS
jgi:acetolactate synthase-1/2/3 large subunit